VAWRIAGQIGPHSEPGVDGSGWLWEIQSDDPEVEPRRVFVQISGSALAASSGNSSDTADAIKTEGLSQVERIVGMDDPPRVIKCSSYGCNAD
jgi:hypothetical protein